MINDNIKNNTNEAYINTSLYDKCTIRCVETGIGSDTRLHYNGGIEEVHIHQKKEQHTRRRIFEDYWQSENKNTNYQFNTNKNRERPKPRRLFPTTTNTTIVDNRSLFQRRRSTPTLPVTLLQRPPIKKTSKSTSSLLKSKNSQRRHKCQREVSFNSKVYIYEYTIPLELLEADATWESFFLDRVTSLFSSVDYFRWLTFVNSCL